MTNGPCNRCARRPIIGSVLLGRQPEIHREADDARQVDRVTWASGDRIRVTYSDGTSIPVIAARVVAMLLAEDAGLTEVPAAKGSACWERTPRTWVV